MKIILNGEACEVTSAILSDLLLEKDFGGRVATAVNENFVPATLRGSTVLQDGDRVEILAPMQGG